MTLPRSKKMWRYLALRRIGDISPAIAVLATALVGIYAGMVVLLFQAAVGLFTDISFFEAFRDREQNGR